MNFTKTEMYMDTSKVTRFELITENGRSVVEYNCEVELSLQDDGQTLKVFVKRREQDVIPTIEDLNDTTSQPVGFKFRHKGNLLEIAPDEPQSTICEGCVYDFCGLEYTKSCLGKYRFDETPIIFKQINHEN